MRVLVAEDDRTSRDILTAVLRKWGHDPVAVDNGNDAWDIMQHKDAPELALLDWEMPGLDGLEVCRKIRSKMTSSPPYLIILTARGETGDIVQGLDAGANDYISKPYNNDELQARLRVGERMMELQSELLATKDALAREAMYDALTGALNRRAVLSGLEKEIKRAERRNSTLTIGLCDIDHFKQVNDTFGHQTGDDVLQGLVETIQHNLREFDLMGRYGGEEFLVVVPDSGRSMSRVYERVRTCIADSPIITRSGKMHITLSIGVTWTSSDDTVDGLLAAADAALYAAKREGRNKVAYASECKLSETSNPVKKNE
ncbi:MAG TPA: diguanylate cyclase [Desulfotignum sp.]|nr:diguanylate cyclase [Desulfotignum sp.]